MGEIPPWRIHVRAVLAAIVAVNVAVLFVAVALTRRPDRALLEEQVGSVAVNDFSGIAWVLTGAVVAWLRPRSAVAWLLIGSGTCSTLSVGLTTYGAFGLLRQDAWWPGARWSAWIGAVLWLPALVPLANVLPAFYPSGRLPGRRWRLPVAAVVAGTGLLVVAALLDPGFFDDVAPGVSPPLSGVALARVLYVVAAAFLIPATLAIWVMSFFRLARAQPPERQQLAWLVLVVVLIFGVLFIPGVPEWAWHVELYLLPLAVSVGIFRYNLLGIEFVLRRGLVYGTLTAVLVAVYLAVTAFAGSQLDRQPLPGLVAAMVVAVVLTPLRERLQRAIDRLVYGDRLDPLRAVARVGDRLAADEPDLLPSVLTGITTALRAPGAAVSAMEGRVLATVGLPGPGPVFPLRVGGVEVGFLEVAARSAGETYSGPDQRLLAALAPQVAVVVRALELAEALEAERDRVVAATSAERDRLRRDLHDGLGPALSGIRLGLHAAHEATIAGNPVRAGELLERLRAEVDMAVGETRRIIDDLRPAALDGGSLVEALRRYAAQLSGDLNISIASTHIPTLRPEVETATYRIAQEALTNVVRHAKASNAELTLSVVGNHLSVEVRDDGVGVDSRIAKGVGLNSMRHRAEALGGTLKFARSDSGSTLSADLPLGNAEL